MRDEDQLRKSQKIETADAQGDSINCSSPLKIRAPEQQQERQNTTRDSAKRPQYDEEFHLGTPSLLCSTIPKRTKRILGRREGHG
jgi:hypothetical protein